MTIYHGDTMIVEEIEREVSKLAEQNGLELTENAHKVCSFRARAEIPLSICPCARADKERYCISKKCMDDIEAYGVCHCQVFKKKGK